jgi:uncharacterized protein (TIGR02594 family)
MSVIVPQLPQQYRWLTTIGLVPRMIGEALKEFGTVETPGSKNNPKIMAWAKETGLAAPYTADSVPWCGLFMAVVAKRAEKPAVSSPLWALSWAKFGIEAGQPRLGDVLTFTRNGGGHVALYIGEDKAAYHVLGGNQSDAVGFTRIDKARLYRVRRPAYKQAPDTVRPFVLAPTGVLSEDEA